MSTSTTAPGTQSDLVTEYRSLHRAAQNASTPAEEEMFDRRLHDLWMTMDARQRRAVRWWRPL